MADPRRLREILGFGYGAPSPAMSALEPFHAGVDPAYMPQDVVTESPTEGPRGWVRSGLESLFGAVAPNERVASQAAEKVTNLSDFVNVPQEAFDIGQEIGNTLQGGDPRMLAMSLIPGKADEIVPAVKAAQKKLKAYHSSPHDFDKFEFSPRTSHTGEGAQAYGAGLYTAESPAVSGRGGQYDRQFTAKKMGKTDTTPFEDAILREMGDDTSISDAEILHRLQTKGFGWKGPDGYPAYEEMEEAIRNTRANASHIYEVNINADPDAFLDWDKPLSEQPKGVQDLFHSATSEMPDWAKFQNGDDPLGSDIYEAISDQTDKARRGSMPYKERRVKGTEQLKQAGIPGIKYLDAGSRANVNVNDIRGTVSMLETAVRKNPQDSYLADQLASAKQKLQQAEAGGSRNYVVFSDEIIDIVKKYGIAGALAAGLITQQMADQLQAQQGGGQS